MLQLISEQVELRLQVPLDNVFDPLYDGPAEGWKIGDVDLTVCDRERIRVPGAVQPHGLLLVLESGSERIFRSAGNANALLAWEQKTVGSSFCDLTGTTFRSLAEAAGMEAGREPLFLGSFSPPMRPEIDILAHERQDLGLVELEPALPNRLSAARLFARLRGGVTQIKSAKSERVSQESLQAGKLVRNIRKLAAGGRTVLEPHSVQELVESACSIALIDAHQLGIQTDLEIKGDLHVLADSVQIQQVLLDLIRNSIEAMEANGPQERRLTISADCGPDDFVELKIADSGPGISRDVRERLFSAFNSSKDDGLGIGLSICRTIVEAHGGRIYAGASEAGGAVFTFTLQKAPERARSDGSELSLNTS